MEGLEAFFQSLGGGWGYVFLFLSALGENLFPPLPGDTFVILGAFLVGRGKMAFLPAYAATTAGSLAGFMVLFALGYRWGIAVVGKLGMRGFSGERLERVEAWLHRWGYGLIGVNRFLSGFRGVVSFAAGSVKMHPVRVFVLALLSCVLWNAILMGVGIWVGENWMDIVRNYQRVVFVLLALGFAVLWLRIASKRRRRPGTAREP